MKFEEIEVGDYIVYSRDMSVTYKVTIKFDFDKTIGCAYCDKYTGDVKFVIIDEENLGDMIRIDPITGDVGVSGEMVVNASGGKKQDGGKVDPTILLKDLHNSVQSVIRVLEFGAQKYGRANYSLVENERYEAALSRHWLAYLAGEESDPDTGESHLSHLICCALFLLEKEYIK